MTYAFGSLSRLRPRPRPFQRNAAWKPGFKAGCGNSHRPAPSAKHAAAGRTAVAKWSHAVAKAVA